MVKVAVGGASLTLFLAISPSAFAQVDAGAPPLPSQPITIAVTHVAAAPDASDRDVAERIAEAEQWVADYAEWKQWAAQWRNRRQPGWFTGFQTRREAPVPPAWLHDRCAWVFDDADPLAAACAQLREWNEDDSVTQLRQVSAAATAQREEESKTTWWEHLHVDMLWPAMQAKVSMYGVIGMHSATTVSGRFHVFIAPGAMLLNLPARNGSRAWKFAANYGIGYRLFEFPFPGNRVAILHVNAARAWVMGNVADVATGRTTDFAGFSMTFKKIP